MRCPVDASRDAVEGAQKESLRNDQESNDEQCSVGTKGRTVKVARANCFEMFEKLKTLSHLLVWHRSLESTHT